MDSEWVWKINNNLDLDSMISRLKRVTSKWLLLDKTIRAQKHR